MFLSANAGVGLWKFEQYNIDVDIVSLNTVATYHIVAPLGGTITKIWSVIDSAIGTADTILTLAIGGVAVTNGVVTIAFTGSAAGDIDVATPTALNTITQGQQFTIACNGASTGAARCHVSILLLRTA
jgi:hypothetical protein